MRDSEFGIRILYSAPHCVRIPHSAFRIAAALLLVAACGRGTHDTSKPSSDPAKLRDIRLPDFTRVDAPVEAQIRERYASLTKLRDSGTAAPRDLGAAFGEYGMLLHAAEYLDTAEPAYLNAQALVPDDMRWPYYLAHLYRTQGNTAQAIASFKRVLELRPDDVSTLIWLGRMYLDQGDAAQAESLFARAQSLAPQAVAAQAGLGQAALARKDYARAVQLLEGALAIDPTMASIYSPLATAYRGLGQMEKAEAAGKQWRNTEITVPDPLRAELNTVLQSGLSYELRGVRALDSRNFPEALSLFREGLKLAPPGSALERSLRHKVGTALALSGDVPGAVAELEEALRRAPRSGLDEPAAKASYSLGLLNASNGRTAQALELFNAAIRYNPNYIEAHMALADLLRTSGRMQPALAEYQEAFRINPRLAQARFGYAMTLVRMRKFADARRSLEESVRAQPDTPELANALARLLAAAPDPAVRDGRRALAMTEALAKTANNTDVGETMAMALAETGAFSDAVAVQRDVIDAARQSGATQAIPRMTANLRLYESGRPCRTPWPDDHPVFASVLR